MSSPEERATARQKELAAELCSDLYTYEVGIAIDGVPTYVLEVPTTQGREAAERRAVVAIFHRDKVDLDRITVCDAEVGA